MFSSINLLLKKRGRGEGGRSRKERKEKKGREKASVFAGSVYTFLLPRGGRQTNQSKEEGKKKKRREEGGGKGSPAH